MARVRVRHGEDEIEIEGSGDFITKRLTEFYEKLGRVPTRGSHSQIKEALLEERPKPATGRALTPAEFYKAKGRTDGLSQILIFGKYLEEYKGTPEFTRREVNKIAKDAKVSKDIHSQYFTNAVKQGLLRPLSGGKYSLTLSAEEALASM